MDRPILFNGDMVRAILSGRKTQTRRIMKVQPPTDRHQLLHIMDSTDRRRVGKSHWAVLNAEKTSVIESDKKYFSSPYGKPGDRLWVRETWRQFQSVDECGCSESPCGCPDNGSAIFRADGSDSEAKWRPSIHMPRWATRITLEITDVRVDRLQDISEADAKAEGVMSEQEAAASGLAWFDKPRRAFWFLWKAINGTDSWDANPWVWVIEFRRVD